MAQDAEVEAPAVVETETSDAAAAEETGSAEETGAEQVETAGSPSTVGETSDAAEGAIEDETAADAVAGVAELQESGSDLEGFAMLALVIALFIVPMFSGSLLSKFFKMPDHSWKFSLAIGTLLAAAVVISLGEVKFGPDLSGGITLIYELQDTALRADPDQNADGGSRRDRPAT